MVTVECFYKDEFENFQCYLWQKIKQQAEVYRAFNFIINEEDYKSHLKINTIAICLEQTSLLKYTSPDCQTNSIK